ncbi:hypothetical protein [Thioalkalivibrio sp. XN8]|uniref:hypothetical protein n=1 Tax=Thioalkalivibrio sp. XN8 TaxID=2712863 RepID=UPI0013EA7950|nr:hypothetical protein [Thioalkalivibrio sp. XN8]NGP52738.1 hypothetical protein [Thioalkalivibrio sp. XN8]
MHDPMDKRFQQRMLNMLWYTALGGPLLVAVIMLAIPYGPMVEWLPRQLLWQGSLVALALLLAAGRPFTRQRMAPDRVAAGAKPWRELEHGDVEGEAFVRVQFAAMRTAALLDVIPVAVLLLAILHADPLLALADGVLALVAAAIAKPDFVNTLLTTESRLRRG